MNQYVQDKIISRSQIYGCHYTEQYKYLPPSKIKTHVIHFENLEKEFNVLMLKYDLHIKLDSKDNSSVKRFTIKDFSNETIKLINKVYHKDFIIFNYEKL